MIADQQGCQWCCVTLYFLKLQTSDVQPCVAAQRTNRWIRIHPLISSVILPCIHAAPPDIYICIVQVMMGKPDMIGDRIYVPCRT